MTNLIFHKLSVHDNNSFYSDMLAAQDIALSKNNTFVSERQSSRQLHECYEE